MITSLGVDTGNADGEKWSVSLAFERLKASYGRFQDINLTIFRMLVAYRNPKYASITYRLLSGPKMPSVEFGPLELLPLAWPPAVINAVS